MIPTHPAPCDPPGLLLLLEGELAPPAQAALERHLADCPSCRATLDLLAGDDRWWDAARRNLTPQPGPAGATPLPPGFPGDPVLPVGGGRLGPFEVEGEIARGGMGVVLKAFDPALGRTVAIKVLTTALAQSGPARERFAREARAAAAVNHEHVVAVHSAQADGDLPYLVMEYVRGRSLQQQIDETGPLGLEEVLRVGAEAAAGLAAAHARGLIHRDVKPANILLEDATGRVKLTDFGLARTIGEPGVTHNGAVVGTPHYMSPEQGRGAPLDARTDLFSLGSTLFAAYTGVPPFRGETPLAVVRAVIEDDPRPLAGLRPDAPPWVGALLARLLVKDPARRPRSAEQVADLFARCLAYVRRSGSTSLPACLRPPRRRGWWMAAVSHGVVAVAAATTG
ncbi:MAG: serine/threonine protein kinase, partial [Gemmataceae bacterium]|nr:serine/threonine protein kinase [Gemmataceae bacterium]